MSNADTADTPAPTRIEPFEEQRAFLQTAKKYYGYISGVGAGKTYAGIIRTILNMTEWNPGEMGAIVAPTRQMVVNVIIPEMRQLGLFDPPINWQYNSAHSEEPGIHAPNGSRALVLSADNRKTIERLRGLNLAWFWIDEESEVPPRAREILTQRIRVGQYRNGYMTTTPSGMNHTYDFFVGDHAGEYREVGTADVFECADRLSLLRVPSHANPHNPDDYLDSLEKDHSGQRYEQEVLGDFVKFEGLVYTWFGDENKVAREALPDTYDETIYGLDFGGSVPSAIVCLRRDGEDWYAVDEFYQPRVTDDTLVEELQRMHDEHGRGRIYADHEPRTIQKLKREGLSVEEADKSVDEGIRHVEGLRENLHVAADLQNLVNEFNQYQYKDGMDAPLKENDHLMDALRYALFTNDTALEGGGVVMEW
jgi:PBSX family phage terminase large subunit